MVVYLSMQADVDNELERVFPQYRRVLPLAEIPSTSRAGVAAGVPPEREQSFGGGGGGTCSA